MRVTIHLVSRADYWPLADAIRDARRALVAARDARATALEAAGARRCAPRCATAR